MHDELERINNELSALKSVLMDTGMELRKEKITYELKRAIRNINRNLYEWKKVKHNKSNFSISYTEVYSVTRNWIIRCLRSIIDAATVDRIFKGGHLYISVDEPNLCISKLSVTFHETYRSYYQTAKLMEDILAGLDYKALKYNPDDYQPDGVSQRDDEFYYPVYEPANFDVNENKYVTPKT